ncbi:hypothetical protein [Streptomyces sp. E-08]|uniref:hypothetical protein n=1 Tax=Streptomyces sp. E-08 TaxID=3404047 RepID=UPI003CF9A2B8
MTAEAWHARYAALPPQAEPYDDSDRAVYGRPVSAVPDTGCGVDGCRRPVVYSGTRPCCPHAACCPKPSWWRRAADWVRGAWKGADGAE